MLRAELAGLKDDLARLQQQPKIKEERIAVLQNTIENMQNDLAEIAEVLALRPSVEAVVGALARKRALAGA